MYTKKCLICEKEFETPLKSTMTCSKSCASIWRYQKNRKAEDAKVAAHIESKHPEIKYISGHKPHHAGDWKSPRILLKCVRTGIRFYAYESAVRRNDWECYICHPHSHAEIYEEDVAKWNDMINSKPIFFKQCKWCGKTFETTSKFRCYCSKKCGKEKKNQYHTEKKSKRYERAKKNGKYEIISLQRLYVRDKGKCYLCGKHLVLNEDYNRTDAPTIEHVIPICKGGTNTWDNVKLACRKCNDEKGTKIFDV
ncbi:hypothetical protein IMAU70100_01054 [Lactiplantibacillus plantarum]|nr:hypothetical protein [Lactiplantibacillus plantarum]